MRIGFFSDAYLPTKYGVETSIESFRVNLEKLGHEVYIATSNVPGFIETNPRIIRLKSASLGKKTDVRIALPLGKNKKLSDFVKNKFDIVHAHYPFLAGLIGKYIAKKQNIPLVYTQHADYYGQMAAYTGWFTILPHLLQRISVFFANSADLVIAPSEKIKKVLLDSGVKKPIEILATGIDITKFSSTQKGPAREDLLSKYNIPPTAKIILTLGRLGKEKNVDFLIRAFKKISDADDACRFIIVGSGSHLDGLKKLAADLKLTDKVIFTGFIDSNLKAEYYKLASIFAFASHTDTQGIVILEAMASGLPIIALRDGALEGIVIDNQNGFLINQDSLDAFASKALELLTNTTTRLAFSESAKTQASAFSEENQTQKLLSIYSRAINDHQA